MGRSDVSEFEHIDMFKFTAIDLWPDSYDAILCVRQIIYLNKNGGF